MTDRDQLHAIFAAGIAAADPYVAVQAAIAEVAKPAQIIAVGKASCLMARAALAHFSGVPCLVVTNYENASKVDGATVLTAGHPVPDENGLAAGRAVIDALKHADGPVLALISGGGSALLPAPAGRLTLADKAKLNAGLLGAGLDITAMNLVRQQLSDLKGGGFLRLAAPHHVTALILSDVIGDDLSAIASGPTARPIGSASDAIEVLKNANLWNTLPSAVVAHLHADGVHPTLPRATNILIGSNAKSVMAMANVAGTAHIIETPVEGDVADAARFICDSIKPGINVWGGETTVVLKGNGRGGRNQELALRIAIEARNRGWTDWSCLQGGSDGRDGPTDAAGGLVDHHTLSKISDLDAMLENNDSYAALDKAGDLLRIEATGTNVADLGAMIWSN